MKTKSGVLVVLINDGEVPPVHTALIPEDVYNKEIHEDINGSILNSSSSTMEPDNVKIEDAIADLFMRLGLEPSDVNDLVEYLDPKPPFKVTKVVITGWNA